MSVVCDVTETGERILRDKFIRDKRLYGADLQGVDLRGTTFLSCVLQDADLRGAKVEGTDFTDCDTRNMDMRGVDWGRGAYFYPKDWMSVRTDWGFIGYPPVFIGFGNWTVMVLDDRVVIDGVLVAEPPAPEWAYGSPSPKPSKGEIGTYQQWLDARDDYDKNFDEEIHRELTDTIQRLWWRRQETEEMDRGYDRQGVRVSDRTY